MRGALIESGSAATLFMWNVCKLVCGVSVCSCGMYVYQDAAEHAYNLAQWRLKKGYKKRKQNLWNLCVPGCGRARVQSRSVAGQDPARQDGTGVFTCMYSMCVHTYTHSHTHIHMHMHNSVCVCVD